MKVLNNITETVRDDLTVSIKKGSRVSMAAACFSMYAYNELRKQLESVDEFRFIFTSPTFIKEKANKQKREFYIPRFTREHSLYGTEFEIKLRNEMTQKAIARECAEWIRKKATFKSNTSGENMGGFMTVDSPEEQIAYMPINGFTTVDIGCERGNNSYNMVNRMEAPFATQYMQLFEQLWNALPLKLEGLSVDAVYENFVRQIAGERLTASAPSENLRDTVERAQQREKLQKQIDALQAKIRKEKQLNRQMEMNAKLKVHKKELEKIYHAK